MRRIFRLYLEGHGYASIAQQLNADGVPAPRSLRRAGDGWMHSCIREMLRNPKYVGEFAYGARKWQRHPTTRQRVARPSQEADVLREQRPELAIIDRVTWDAVQVRLGRDHSDAGGTLTSRRAEFLPLVFLTQNAKTPSEGGGRCPRGVARAAAAKRRSRAERDKKERNQAWLRGGDTTRGQLDFTVPIEVRVA